eukprot:TRINITY_DN6735_c0_g1_i1.p1 TRINITY_DN6735_c0_g1~~TRINITY_DN6735_c0_g1_i1.p1  ORF type:complete len:403 (+),score=-41.38 TRINITY_DN6735_c0_g1_i1:28-1209(+)
MQHISVTQDQPIIDIFTILNSLLLYPYPNFRSHQLTIIILKYSISQYLQFLKQKLIEYYKKILNLLLITFIHLSPIQLITSPSIFNYQKYILLLKQQKVQNLIVEKNTHINLLFIKNIENYLFNSISIEYNIILYQLNIVLFQINFKSVLVGTYRNTYFKNLHFQNQLPILFFQTTLSYQQIQRFIIKINQINNGKIQKFALLLRQYQVQLETRRIYYKYFQQILRILLIFNNNCYIYQQIYNFFVRSTQQFKLLNKIVNYLKSNWKLYFFLSNILYENQDFSNQQTFLIFQNNGDNLTAIKVSMLTVISITTVFNACIYFFQCMHIQIMHHANSFTIYNACIKIYDEIHKPQHQKNMHIKLEINDILIYIYCEETIQHTHPPLSTQTILTNA